MGERNRWWVIPISLAMVAYGGAVLWSLFVPIFSVLQNIDRLVVALLIVVIGAYAFVMEMIREPEDKTPSLVGQAVEPYLSAWSRLWRTKWLLWVDGCIAALLAISNAASTFMVYRYFHAGLEGNAGGSAPKVVFTAFSFSVLLQNSLQHAYSSFVPTIHVFYGMPLYTVVVFCLAWWALPRVWRLSDDPEYRVRASVFSICAVVAALSGIWVAVLWLMSERWLWMPPAARATTNEAQRLLPYAMIVTMIEIVAICAALIGGVIGSLARNSKGEECTRPTFLADSVRYFVPLALLYLVIDAVYAVPQLMMYAGNGPARTGSSQIVFQVALSLYGLIGLACLLLMFAPFGIVTRKLGMPESVARSFNVWKRLWKRVGAFIASGTCIAGLVMLPIRLPSVMLSPMKESLWAVPLAILVSVAETFVGVLILLAVWEFYQANVIDSESASVTESSPSP
jgi:hypothetical protein